ncbi:hypothetical protein, partial [Pseudomonas quasicaspiana]|uniref:hypothetical protein n=1 Tax=Pseudomonas quasicaspiana TaxID=2829821 RepID=UPI001E408DB7
IHGLRRLNRHPCRFAPRSNVELRPAWFNGALEIKIKSRSRADQKQGIGFVERFGVFPHQTPRKHEGEPGLPFKVFSMLFFVVGRPVVVFGGRTLVAVFKRSHWGSRANVFF